MGSLSKKLEVVANVAIIVVAILLGVVIVQRYVLAPAAPAVRAPTKPQNGTKLSLPDVDWGKSDQTLVIALSTTCHFCTESAPFYQRLAQEKANQGGLRLIAVLPQDVDQGQAYLGKLGVSVDEVRQSELSAVGVSGTPTLILVDRNGTVKESWVGKLPPDKEAEVVGRWRVERAGK